MHIYLQAIVLFHKTVCRWTWRFIARDQFFTLLLQYNQFTFQCASTTNVIVTLLPNGIALNLLFSRNGSYGRNKGENHIMEMSYRIYKMAAFSYLHVFVFLPRIHRLERLESVPLGPAQFEQVVRVILLVAVGPVYSMRSPELVAVDKLGMPLVALASLVHNRSENLAALLDILDNVAVQPDIHFGNLALAEPEVFAMYDFPDLMNGHVIHCYVGSGSDHCSSSFDFADCDFGRHDMVMVNVGHHDDYCENHVVDHDC